MTDHQLYDFAREFCSRAGEHCDAVQVILTNSSGGQTGIIAYGVGNFYARKGACEEFLARDAASTFITEFRKAGYLPDDGDDGESVDDE